MSVDRFLLERTELSSTYDTWQTGLLFAGIIAGVAMAASALCAYQLSEIPKKAARLEAASDAQTLERPPSEWPIRLLEKHGWARNSDVDGLDVFVQRQPPSADGVRITGVLFKRGELTVVWATAVALGEKYVWPYAQDSEVLEDGEVAVPILDAIPKGEVAAFIRQSGNFPVDVIGVGLESSHGGDPADVYRELSDLRGQRLVEALSWSVTVTSPNKVVHYRSLGLGRAQSIASKGTELERKQRSALIVAVARMNNDTVTSPLEATLKNLVLNADLTSLNLSDYEYKDQLDVRLSPPLWFDDSELDEWSVPETLPD
jgi:hypothetical protein